MMKQTVFGGRSQKISALMLVVAVLVLVCVGRSAIPQESPGAAAGEPALIYVSDYFSFIGHDEQGHVAFALDNNRGRDGGEFQAEHFSVLHDEKEGWIEVAGGGAYENVNQELLVIPDSDFFRFEGTPRRGMTITSAANHLVLRLEAIPQRLEREQDGSRFWMGSAPGILEWSGRELKGRVIYEYLYLPDFNRLTRTYWGLWKEFQGFYLRVGGDGDLYLHSQGSELLAPLTGERIGFSVFGGESDTLENPKVDILSRRLAIGFYRWPTAWQIRWEGQTASGTARLELSEQRVLGNWVIGGFAMGIVRGMLTYNGQTWPYYGFAELLM